MKQIFRNNKNYNALVFIDRDGVLNKEVGYLKTIDQIKLLPRVVEGLRLLNKNKIASVVITNQPVIAHGYISIKEEKSINQKIVSMLDEKSAYVDAIYFCPHHPEGSVEKFSIECRCRKPGTLLYEEAIKDFEINKVLGIIGDSTRDIKLGDNVKISTVVVQTGYKGEDGKYRVKADYVCEDFFSGVEKLLKYL